MERKNTVYCWKIVFNTQLFWMILEMKVCKIICSKCDNGMLQRMYKKIYKVYSVILNWFDIQSFRVLIQVANGDIFNSKFIVFSTKKNIWHHALFQQLLLASKAAFFISITSAWLNKQEPFIFFSYFPIFLLSTKHIIYSSNNNHFRIWTFFTLELYKGISQIA